MSNQKYFLGRAFSVEGVRLEFISSEAQWHVHCSALKSYIPEAVSSNMMNNIASRKEKGSSFSSTLFLGYVLGNFFQHLMFYAQYQELQLPIWQLQQRQSGDRKISNIC